MALVALVSHPLLPPLLLPLPPLPPDNSCGSLRVVCRPSAVVKLDSERIGAEIDRNLVKIELEMRPILTCIVSGPRKIDFAALPDILKFDCLLPKPARSAERGVPRNTNIDPEISAIIGVTDSLFVVLWFRGRLLSLIIAALCQKPVGNVVEADALFHLAASRERVSILGSLRVVELSIDVIPGLKRSHSPCRNFDFYPGAVDTSSRLSD
jgi:hypothetical protein